MIINKYIKFILTLIYNTMSTHEIIWTNKKIYNNDMINNHLNFIKNNMDGLLPLYSDEHKRLIVYGQKNNILFPTIRRDDFFEIFPFLPFSS